jgi:uncharacterized HAD superfamily protein
MIENKLFYRSYNDLIELVSFKSSNLKGKYDLILGVPRSGMVPAYIIALNLHLPVIDLDSFLLGFTPMGGARISNLNKIIFKNILIVDDSIQTGNQNNIIRQKLSNFQNFKFDFLAIYASFQSQSKVDFYFEILNSPRIFQWNLLNSWIYEYSCVDIDGVLCEDPTEEQNDDSEKYMNFLINAKPKYIPTCSIGVLVTNRLEKYRRPTEEWLSINNIKYHNLIMLDLPDKQTRIKLGVHSTFKSEVYNKNINHKLFIESSKDQAIEINKITGRNVFCVENMTFYPEVNNFKKKHIRNNFIYLKKIVMKISKLFF